MRMRDALLVVALATGMSGCAWIRSWWPWSSKSEPPVMVPEPGGPQAAATGPATEPGPPVEAAQPAAPPGQVVRTSVLQVNDQYITVNDVLRGAAPRLNRLNDKGDEQAFRRRVALVIEQELARQTSMALFLGEAQRRMGEPEKAHVDNRVKQIEREMIAGAGGSRRKLDEELRRKGATLDEVLEAWRKSLTVRLYLQSQLAPRIQITRQMLLRYYQRHESEFRLELRVQMQIIAVPFSAFLKPSSDSPTAAETKAAKDLAAKRIAQAVRALAIGEKFGEVAKRLSKGIRASAGGLWPPMPAGSFRQVEVERTAFSQRVGQVSDVIETDIGFYVVKTKAVHPGKVIGFEEAQPAIEKKIRTAQSNRLEIEHRKELEEKASIILPPNFIKEAVDLAVATYSSR